MVHSVTAVSEVDKIKRDMPKMNHGYADSKQSDPLFSQILEQKEQELQHDSIACHTVTYGSDSKIHTFQYQSREYHY